MFRRSQHGGMVAYTDRGMDQQWYPIRDGLDHQMDDSPYTVVDSFPR